MAAIDLQFLVDVFDVIFDRFEGNIEPDGHFFVSKALLDVNNEQYNHGTPGNAKAK